MTEPVDLRAEKWRRADTPDQLNPRDALVEALRRIDAGEVAPEHVIVLLGMDDSFDWLQAGKYRLSRQVGLLALAQYRLSDGV